MELVPTAVQLDDNVSGEDEGLCRVDYQQLFHSHSRTLYIDKAELRLHQRFRRQPPAISRTIITT